MMENTKTICGICYQISATAERIAELTQGKAEIGDDSGVIAAYDDARLSELETAQQMILMLTALLTAQNGPGENDDNGEGIFAEGELVGRKGGADESADESADSPTDAGADES